MTEFDNTDTLDTEVTNDAPDVTIIEDEYEAEPKIDSAFDRPGRWYVVHILSGHEKKVVAALDNVIKSHDMTDRVLEVHVPMEDVTEFKNGKKQQVSKKSFPSYMLVRCIPDPEVFSTISATPGITGFVGQSKMRPTPLTRREIDNIIRPIVEGVEQPVAKRRAPTHEFEVNDNVQIKSGPFATFNGHVAEINEDQMRVKVLVDIFGRETPVELEFSQVTKL
jgi:transcriptional antiterminator NusG